MRFFLSHASRDLELAERLRAEAAQLDIEVYLAEHDVRAGFPLASKVKEAIKQCDAFLVLLTTAGSDSAYVLQEIGIAQGSDKLIVPIVQSAIDGLDLATLQGIEFLPLDPSEPSADLDHIMKYLKTLDDRHGLAEAHRQTTQANRQLIFAVGLLILLILAMWSLA